jgi:hypothetical protein
MEKEIKKEDLKNAMHSCSDEELEIRMFCVEVAGRLLEATIRLGIPTLSNDLLLNARRIEAYILSGEILTK